MVMGQIPDEMNVTKQRYFFDVPARSEWFTRFDVLFIKRDHRRILNRQPEVRFFNLSNGLRIVAFLIDMKVISN